MWSTKMAAALSALCCGALVAGSSFKPARPPAVPLAVRSPYLNAWLEGGSTGCRLPGQWPRFWTGSIQGWQGLIAVDGKVYNWMGGTDGGQPLVKQVSLEYTSTRSIFTFDVEGKVELIVTFLSPVFLNDFTRQSQQFSYISTRVKSTDGSQHSVQVYMDVSGEFASGNHNDVIHWSSGVHESVRYLKFARVQEFPFKEAGEIASWGTWYLSTWDMAGVSTQIGQDVKVRGQFTNNRVLTNEQESNFRPVSQDWPVFAISHDLGSVDPTTEQERLFTLGLTQDEVILFTGMEKSATSVPGFWTSSYATSDSAMAAFYNDYKNASFYSSELDIKVYTESKAAAGDNYAILTTLAVRQVFGGLQFGGTPSKPYIFLKEISSNSDIQTVDVIFPAYPIVLYFNPSLARYLLDPLFENQESGAYPNAWAEHDLGTFPIAKGYPAGNDEPMPLEECGNMIIMALAYAQRTGDNNYLAQHYDKLSQWAEFLVEDSLIPAHQLSTDDFMGTLANQTNLAIKGIIGLRAMSEIAKLTNNQDHWGNIASSYLEQWQTLGINRDAKPPHTTLSYGASDSHGTLYNIYADKLLNLNFIPQYIYDMQSNFYPTVATEYGIPLDTRRPWAKSDWEMFAAAVASPATRNMIIGKLAHWVGTTTSNRAMTDLYDVVTGGFPDGPTFVARPVQGGMFALLALK